ncbi:hypothetical protein ABI244_05450 [Serratia ureilytica]|uniref:hypothetical protein n=1 Tax=Serratia ureilytica TaxID=300181 RepID=UPI003265198A
MTEVLTYEALKAERDALAVENAALKSRSIKLFNLGYLHGHESTVEGYFVDVHRNDIDTYHDEVVAEIIEDEDETPATDAAFAAIQARAKAEAFAEIIEFIDRRSGLAEMKTQWDLSSAIVAHISELREAK